MKVISHFIKSIMLVIFLMVVLATYGSTTGKETKVSNTKTNLSVDLNAMAERVEEEKLNDIYFAKESYTGDLTGYGANCPLCSGRLACAPNLDVLHGNVIYNDDTYGDVRIVASSKNLPCGSIIRFDSKRISSDPVVAIVLDRGVLGTAIDLLSVSEAEASNNVGRSKITYDVLRKGW